LIARLDASRARLQHNRRLLEEKLHPLRRVQNAVKKHPFHAFGIAAGGAFAFSLLRRRSSSRPFSFKRLFFRGLFNLAKPTIRLWLLDQAKERFLSPTKNERKAYEANTP